MPFVYVKLKTKQNKKGIPPQIKRKVEKYEQTVSTDLEEETNCCGTIIIL